MASCGWARRAGSSRRALSPRSASRSGQLQTATRASYIDCSQRRDMQNAKCVEFGAYRRGQLPDPGRRRHRPGLGRHQPGRRHCQEVGHTVHAGIDVIDAAPGYKVCEALIGEAFEVAAKGVRITTKCGIGSPPAEKSTRASAPRSNRASPQRGSNSASICFFSTVKVRRPTLTSVLERVPAPVGIRDGLVGLFRDAVMPAFERLQARGPDRRLGIAQEFPTRTIDALGQAPRPTGGPGRAHPPRQPPRRCARRRSRATSSPPRRRMEWAGATMHPRRAGPVRSPGLSTAHSTPERPRCARLRSRRPVSALAKLARGPGHSRAPLRPRDGGVDTLVLGVKNRQGAPPMPQRRAAVRSRRTRWPRSIHYSCDEGPAGCALPVSTCSVG